MRTLGPRTHLLLAIAAAAGLIASLGLPWYGRGPRGPEGGGADLTARMDAAAALAGRVLEERSGIAGWDVLGRGPELALSGLAGAVMLLLALSLVPALAQAVQGLTRAAALGAAGVLAWQVVDAPAAVNGLEPRIGVAAAMTAASVLLVSVAGAAVAARPRREPARAYTPPPAPAYDPTASYGPPQF
jgi:hypothetical protein